MELLQEQHSPRPQAMAAAVEALRPAAARLGLVPRQQHGPVPAHPRRGHEQGGDPDVQRAGEAEPGRHGCSLRRLVVLQLPLALPVFPGLVHHQRTLLPEATDVLPGRGAAAGGGDQAGLRAGGQHEEHRGAAGAGAALREPAGHGQAQVNGQQQQGLDSWH